jgi:hypothetical protein
MSFSLLEELGWVLQRCATRAAATMPDKPPVRRRRALRSALFAPLALTASHSISTGMSDPQSEMYVVALEEAWRADQKKRAAAEALRARQHEYETANLRGRQRQIERARVAMAAAQAAFDAAERDVQRLDDKAEEVVQARVRAAYM